LLILNHNSFRVLFEKTASVCFIWKIYLYFSIVNGQPRELAIGTFSFPIILALYWGFAHKLQWQTSIPPVLDKSCSQSWICPLPACILRTKWTTHKLKKIFRAHNLAAIWRTVSFFGPQKRRLEQGRLRHINDGANAPWKKIGGRFLQEPRGEVRYSLLFVALAALLLFSWCCHWSDNRPTLHWG